MLFKETDIECCTKRKISSVVQRDRYPVLYKETDIVCCTKRHISSVVQRDIHRVLLNEGVVHCRDCRIEDFCNWLIVGLRKKNIANREGCKRRGLYKDHTKRALKKEMVA